MDIEKLYEGLKRLLDKGVIGNAYGGCGYGFDESDINVLDDFFEYIIEKYEHSMPL